MTSAELHTAMMRKLLDLTYFLEDHGYTERRASSICCEFCAEVLCDEGCPTEVAAWYLKQTTTDRPTLV